MYTFYVYIQLVELEKLKLCILIVYRLFGTHVYTFKLINNLYNNCIFWFTIWVVTKIVVCWELGDINKYFTACL